ncbi:OsmC family protein [Roseivirga sp. BDSF3-8]|uniref:OsmC family protein n=1 Tax=Roseivirga sp. BDSF3-8 TaxID=3241598 RepID=UPI0035325006
MKIDMRSAPEKSGHSPMELLLSAISACAAVDIVEILKKKRKTVEDLIISAEGDRNAEPPRYYTAVRLHFTLVSPDTDAETLKKVVALGVDKYCSVASSINKTTNISYTTEVLREKVGLNANS